MERRNLSSAKKEFTTQKIRQEWAEHEEQFVGVDGNSIAEDWPTQTSSVSTNDTMGTSYPAGEDGKPIEITKDEATALGAASTTPPQDTTETKSKKKRRKKSLMKKKATQRKSSSSSSVGSAQSDQNDIETDTISISNNTATGSSNEDSPKSEAPILMQLTKDTGSMKIDEKQMKTTYEQAPPYRSRDLDIHFFSDTELATAKSPSRPSTPIQSDSEFEMSHRADKSDKNDVMSSSASWKWGELPTQDDDSQEPITEDAKQAQRNSMLSNMFSFMKQTKKLRKSSTVEGVYLSDLDTDGMDPEVAALYFPPINKKDTSLNALATNEDDRESGNGTSLPHSPSSMEGMKSLDSDYDDGKPVDNK